MKVLIAYLAGIVLLTAFLFSTATKPRSAEAPETQDTASTSEEVPTETPDTAVSEAPKEAPNSSQDDTPLETPDTSETGTVTTPSPSLLASAVNQSARSAMVNLLCRSRNGRTTRTISGSGIIIDPQGVILTNAHVAWPFLIDSPNTLCTVRTGNPARDTYFAAPLYISESWIRENASALGTGEELYGTGENDYALLLITKSVNKTSLPTSFPSIERAGRSSTPDIDDTVLTIAYPAEFLRPSDVREDLFLTSDDAVVTKHFTFSHASIDLFSVTGTILAQRGASGGAVVDKQGRLAGIIVTSTEEPELGTRSLGSLTLPYISADLEDQTGMTLTAFLESDLREQEEEFANEIAPDLRERIE